MSNFVNRVLPYVPGSLGTFGTGRAMLIQQYQFPHEFDERDVHEGWRTDQFENKRDSEVLIRYLRIPADEVPRGAMVDHPNFGMYFEQWARRSGDPDGILASLIEPVRANKRVKWTGFRISGMVYGGRAMFTLELFAKHPESKTVVYSDEEAPNVGQP